MGLFKKRVHAPARTILDDFSDGISFKLPGRREDVVALFAHYFEGSGSTLEELGHLVREYFDKYGNEFGVEAADPPAPAIYAQFVSEDRIVIRAGSKVNELWRIVIDLRDAEGGVAGTAKFYPNWGDEHIWLYNVIHIFSGFRGAVEISGGKVEPAW